jgi:flagellar hook assembly protein FlgD
MKFVFTLTGTNVPEDIRIKIANSSGRVVKEVNKEELGAIHIGNNITDWTWNGTDQFGDMLANGPYFYTVTVKDKGEDVKLRATKGDGSFKNQTGVIYLLR